MINGRKRYGNVCGLFLCVTSGITLKRIRTTDKRTVDEERRCVTLSSLSYTVFVCFLFHKINIVIRTTNLVVVTNLGLYGPCEDFV
jgi:hypothetical protein